MKADDLAEEGGKDDTEQEKSQTDVAGHELEAESAGDKVDGGSDIETKTTSKTLDGKRFSHHILDTFWKSFFLEFSG